MLPFLLSFCLSWNDMALTVAMELMFRSAGDDGRNLAKKVLDAIGEKVDRPSLSAAWIDYVERPPFNTISFNHWRYIQNPIGNFTTSHKNEDIMSTLSSLNKSLFPPTVNGAWPINFAYKTFFGLFLEAFDPTHAVEYFSDQIPGGDNNGKLFSVLVDGKETNIHDYWGSLCGQFTHHYPFDETAYESIDGFVTKIFKEQPSSKLFAITDASQILNDSVFFAQSHVYANVEFRKELSEDYKNSCKVHATQRLAKAAYSLSSLQRTMKVPAYDSPSAKIHLSKISAAGIGTLLLVLPVALYFACQLFKSALE